MKKRKSPKHGTYSVYVNYRCRCERCRAANAERAKRDRDRRAQALEKAVELTR